VILAYSIIIIRIHQALVGGIARGIDADPTQPPLPGLHDKILGSPEALTQSDSLSQPSLTD